ncbi:multidrug ABC transporter ATP-binding protein [Pseudoflavonifractor sp. An176]|uniref:ABC transporter ATP-binding protein n=1 Tax=Pseudoflavonifractor sp. An176 TaxID=1965572 RepID=UPI000B3A4382|nr:ABC transporter ATP-binding protein [Pseudoflavonifractor sp. An176]OUP66143.1 multidrug ABC transporter ATP-binding protein [Pseudoflavonifractor sp. An176]
MILTAEHISKTIRGREILSNVSLELHSGKVYGFVGRNGSGKTMLFRALSGLMGLTSGTVRWGDQVLKRDFAVLPNLGIVLENVGLYPNLTGLENLRYLANIRKKCTQEDLRAVLERVGLDPDDKRTYGKYSLGMKQRLAIAQAIMEQPDVLMLDEPTNALDSEAVVQVRDIITQEKERGALVLLASHNYEDIRLLSDEVYHLESGRLREEGVG